MIRYGLYLSDLNRESTDSHGIINYALGLAASLPTALRAEERLIVYANRQIAEELPERMGAMTRLRLHDLPRGVVGRLRSDHLTSVKRALEDQVDLLHFPKGHLPLRRRGRMRLVSTIHDDIPIRYAEAGHDQRVGLKTRYFAWAIRHALASADLIITVSEFSQRRLAGLSGDPGTPITVSYEGITLPEQPHVPLPERDPVVLHLGSKFPHKRTREAIEMTSRFLDEYDDSNLRLVVTGDVGPELESLVASAGASMRSMTLSNAALAALMARCRALVFTSEYEGFGLPPVEAYSLGTPVVYARAAALPEVMAGAPGGYRSGDYEDFRRAMEEVLTLDEERMRGLREMFRTRYSWEAVARRTLNAYRHLLSAGPG